MSRLVILATIVALLPVASVSAQSLAEAAAKEQERRKKAAESTKVITEDELRRQTPGSGTFSTVSDTPAGSAAVKDAKASPAPGAPGASPAPGAPAEKTADEIKAEEQAAWREKLDDTQKQIQQLQTRIDALQRVVNDITVGAFNPARAAQISQLEDLQKQLAAAQKQVADLQEEGRRKSYR